MSIQINKFISIMAANRTTAKFISFNYNFTRDGGALGSIGMGIFIPSGSLIVGYFIQPITNLVSATDSSINIGVPSEPILIVDSLSYTSFNPPADYTGLKPCNLSTPSSTLSEEVIFTINDDVLTAGAANVGIFYVKMEQL